MRGPTHMTHANAAARPHSTYDPATDLATRWPDWTSVLVRLVDRTEVIVPDQRLIIIDKVWARADPRLAIAHVLAHLDLGHHLLADWAFTEAHERDAHGLAALRLDRQGVVA